MPSRLDASVVKAVVLSGVGGLRVFFRAVDLLDRAGGLGVGDRCLGLLLLPELVGRVLGDEVAVGMREGGRHLPEGHGLVGAALELALDDQAERRALHAADREEVGSRSAGWPSRPSGSAWRPRSGRCPGGRRRHWRAASRARRGRRRRARSRPWSAPSSGRASRGCRPRARPRRWRGRGWPRRPPAAPRGRSARPRGRSRSRSRGRRRPRPPSSGPGRRSCRSAP